MGRPHGLRGAFFVAGRDTPIPASYGDLRIGETAGGARSATIRASHMQGDRPVLVCTLASDRTAAEALTGQWIYIDSRRAHSGAEDELLWGELPDAEVLDAAGVSMGRVKHVYNAGASDVIEVHDSAGRSLDIPLIDDYLKGGVEGAGADRQLRLAVPAAVFEGLWQTPKPKSGGDA